MIKLKSLIKELSYDSPFSDFATKVRAARMNPPKKDSGRSSTSRSSKNYAKISRAITQVEEDLVRAKEQYRDVMFELEQTAEPEGGPIADRIGKEMERLESKIQKLESKKEQLYKKLRS